ncbi:hypothetical protein JRO89_XS07G0077200 [Xanthoceras sorbifolium]|uniref:C2 domain-containing protein n=1 Tax=Xanthoceras sorbifolium TaxID=99658 RepID=A0ABQ8HT39_9ROSI|nr:hypothetical protein JRO89_XS07G0077200 [Xanthoceras sorbifolium]
MSISGIQGLPLEITVVGCYNLKDTEWISRQDPYICIEYGSNKFRTKTCTDGGKNPTFQERFVFTLFEGLREMNVVVWNSHTIKSDEFIGSGKIQLHKALSQGFDDAVWPLQSKTSRHAGEIRLILHFSSSNAISNCNWVQQHSRTKLAPSAPQYATPSAALTQLLPQDITQHAPPAPYQPPTPYNALTHYASYPPQPTTYPPSSYPPTPPAGYPPQTNPPAAYPPAGYPPQTYPPAGQPYPAAPQAPTYSTYPPPGPPSGSYPPPPYY